MPARTEAKGADKKTCTDETIKEVTQLVQLGVPPLTAALSKGVSEELFCEWMEKGAQRGKGNWRFAKFYDAVNKAEADAESILVGRIRAVATETWGAAAWLLERRFPEKYVRRSVTTKEDMTQDAASGDPFADVDNVMPISAARGKQTK